MASQRRSRLVHVDGAVHVEPIGQRDAAGDVHVKPIGRLAVAGDVYVKPVARAVVATFGAENPRRV